MKKTLGFELSIEEIEQIIGGWVAAETGKTDVLSERPKVEFEVDSKKRVRSAKITVQTDE